MKNLSNQFKVVLWVKIREQLQKQSSTVSDQIYNQTFNLTWDKVREQTWNHLRNQVNQNLLK